MSKLTNDAQASGNNTSNISDTEQSFKRWALLQTKRDDPVGDVARDIKHDVCFPARPRSLRQCLNHLDKAHGGGCDGARDALEEAWKEYQTAQEPAASLA